MCIVIFKSSLDEYTEIIDEKIISKIDIFFPLLFVRSLAN